MDPSNFPPLKVKKNCFDYEVLGIQIDRLGLTISRQKSILKICTESRDICQNAPNLAGLVWKPDFGPFLVIVAEFVLGSPTEGSQLYWKWRKPKTKDFRKSFKERIQTGNQIIFFTPWNLVIYQRLLKVKFIGFHFSLLHFSYNCRKAQVVKHCLVVSMLLCSGHSTNLLYLLVI